MLCLRPKSIQVEENVVNAATTQLRIIQFKYFVLLIVIKYLKMGKKIN